MESMFHKHHWDKNVTRSVSLEDVGIRLVRLLGVLKELHLADLTAQGVMAGYFGLNLEQLASRNYRYTQQVSAQVHAMLRGDGESPFDGVLYPSRNNYSSKSIALFQRAQAKIKVVEDVLLPDHKGWPSFVARYRILIVKRDLC